MAVAIVTGASRGIGREICLRLASAGWDVAGCFALESDASRQTAADTAGFGVQTLFDVCDVRDHLAVDAFVKNVEASLGEIDLLVTNAGITRDAPTVLATNEMWDDVVDTNLKGTYNFARTVSFRMMKRRRGCIITMSSISGIYGQPGQTNYAASKAGIIGFTKSLAKELARFGIRVNSVAPGFIETDMTAELNEAQQRQALERIPIQRYGTTADIADAVEFLASSKASYITGHVLQVDGGMTL